ncbi:MAG TPA: ribosome-associated translation inhibitor RaiA [Actinomycetota bacterium]|jgi:ribosomal subunit interface protein|nr:ribosome-associated translation inhibitor RaiA [Actinomycetota bacterium]
MDLVLKGRGTRITEHMRGAAEHKLARLGRMAPRVTRIEIEVISEKNPRQGGVKRVEAALETPRKTFRAVAMGSDVDSALDQLAEKLERQLRDHREKRRTRLVGGGKRLKSAQAETTSQEGSEE